MRRSLDTAKGVVDGIRGGLAFRIIDEIAVNGAAEPVKCNLVVAATAAGGGGGSICDSEIGVGLQARSSVRG